MVRAVDKADAIMLMAFQRSIISEAIYHLPFSMQQIKKTTAGNEIILKADNTVRYSAECCSLAAIDSWT